MDDIKMAGAEAGRGSVSSASSLIQKENRDIDLFAWMTEKNSISMSLNELGWLPEELQQNVQLPNQQNNIPFNQWKEMGGGWVGKQMKYGKLKTQGKMAETYPNVTVVKNKGIKDRESQIRFLKDTAFC